MKNCKDCFGKTTFARAFSLCCTFEKVEIMSHLNISQYLNHLRWVLLGLILLSWIFSVAALHLATQQLADAKAKYKSLPQAQQETLQVTDTELPELIETHLRAKNVYDTVVARHATNQRYLNALKQKNASS
jgi:hypothetical protein